MKVFAQVAPVFAAVLALGASSLKAQVSISELSAESSEWRLKWDANEQPSVGAGVAWWSPESIPANAWQSGAAPFGWDTGTVATNLRSAMRGITPSLYLRREFNITAGQAASGSDLMLDIEYDDGVIVWINGVEVARCNMGAEKMQIYREQIAFNSGSTVGNPEVFNLGSANALLTSGSNTVAIQVANNNISSAMFVDAELAITGGATLVNTGATWDYHVGLVEPSGGVFEPAFGAGEPALVVDWGKVAFDDASWDSSAGPIGYDNGSDYTLGVNLRTQMQNIYTSVYMRQSFNMTAAEIAAAGGLQLTADYDDGFIVFLNGVEIARGNMGSAGEFIAFSATSDGGHNASMDGGGDNSGVIETLNLDTSLLVEGENVLAAQLHNSSSGSSDLLLDMQLSTTGGGPGVVAPNNGNFSYFLGASEPSTPPAPAPEPPSAEFVDWFELHNAGGAVVDISGWSISDDVALPTKFVFPAGTTIPAGGYFVVLADDNEEFNDQASYMHASFSLAADGETLTLYDAATTSVSSVDFPPQRVTQSFGRDPGGATYGYLDQPTPGTANAGPFYGDRVDAPDFSVPGGFHSGSVTVALTSNTLGATIRYTTDGTDPTPTNGTVYSGALTLNPINNKTGHVIRARAFKNGCLESKIKTHTYLINQSSQLTGVPALIFSGDEEETFYKPNGVLSIEGGTYPGNQWQSNGKSSYNFPINRGRPYERAAFIEYFEPDGDSFREEAGIRIAASGYSRPRMILNQTSASPFPSDPNQKPSFNVWFRGDYGDADLDFPWVGDDYPVKRFEQLRSRAGKNDIRNPFIVDELVRRLYHDMGQESALGVINTLYINGEFKGFYNLCERLREPFMRDHHNSDGEWDIRQVNEFAEGDAVAWNEMFSRIGQNLDSQANWDAALEYIDPVAIADYYLLNSYAATWDWPQNNWVAARERSPDGRFRFYVWDAEGGFHSQGYFNPITHNTIVSDLLSKSDTNSQVFQRLHGSAEWRLIFADRVHKHMFNGGVIDDRDLASSNIRQRKDELVGEFQPLLSFVHSQTINQSWYNSWVNQSSGRRTYLFGPADDHYRDNDLWPSTEPPVYNQHGGDVSAGFNLTMSKSDPGTIYYTLDGGDPREFGGAIAPGAIAYSSGVALNDLAITAKARVRNSSGEWSALTEAEFKVGTVPATSANLAVVEVMYNPVGPTESEIAAGYLDDDEFEFVRLQNISGVPIDLTDARFSAGVTFQFIDGSVPALSPGGTLLLVENIDAFRERYGTSHDALIAGQFGGRLSNGGEAILVDDTSGTPIQSFTYSDNAPWPEFADGSGLSLQIIDPSGDHNDPANWQASSQYGGTPGGAIVSQGFGGWQAQHFSAAQLADPTISGPDADADGDGWSNFLEFALGTLPWWDVPHLALPEAYVMTAGADDYLALEFASWAGAAGVTYTVQVTTDLAQWDDGAGFTTVVTGPTDNGDGTVSMVVRDLTPTDSPERRFIRLFVTDE